ncbi:MAG TPA: hypothetical protein VHA75_13815 [Rugosimonospora sp.]|nr:hypothetical protein [Rugosimonospora sp.]
MSPLVAAAPTMVRADLVGSAAGNRVRRTPVVAKAPGALLTKRRPVDFGLVTSCLCRCR